MNVFSKDDNIGIWYTLKIQPLWQKEAFGNLGIVFTTLAIPHDGGWTTESRAIDRLETMTLKWYGHVQKMIEELRPNNIISWYIIGQRKPSYLDG